MGVLLGVMAPLRWINEHLLSLGRALGVVCVAAMVVAILVQVFFRYVLGNALPWPDEAARFLMLWMTGLMAPTALRRGGFVAIDMLVLMLPRRAAAALSLLLLFVMLLVFVTAFRIGWSEITGIGGRFTTVSLWVPVSIGLDEWVKVPRSWMMMSIHVGVTLMIMVTVELILRSVITILGGADHLPEIPGTEMAGAE